MLNFERHAFAPGQARGLIQIAIAIGIGIDQWAGAWAAPPLRTTSLYNTETLSARQETPDRLLRKACRLTVPNVAMYTVSACAKKVPLSQLLA